MREVFHIFLSIPGGAKWRVLLSVLLANLCEGVGLMAMLPVLERVAGDGGPPSALQDAMFRALDVLGIPQDIEILLLFVVLGMVLKGILMVFAMRSVGRAVADVATGLRKDLIDGILRARWSWFTHQPIGRIANTISVDASRAGDAFRLATLFVAAILQAVVYIGLSVFASWQLALCALCVGLAILYVLRPLVSVTKRSGRVQRQKTEELVTLMTDALGNIKPLKAMARQANLLRFVDKKIHSLRKEMRRAAVYKQVMKSLQELIMAMLVAGGFYVAYTFLDASASEIVFAAFLLQKTVKAINTIQEQQQEAALVESAFFAVRDAVAHARSHEERLPAGDEPALEEGIRFEDVSFAFDDRPVLDRISLEIPARQLTVITGASGAGKTTITDLLLGLHEPTGGCILIDDHPLPSLDLHAWRRLVGYVPQELTLFHDSVLANVTFGDPQIPEQQAIEALRTAGAWEFVSDLPDGIHTTVGERGSRFSGGQRQRISLARALVFHPKLLILDEVTSALDPDTEAEVCRNVLDISRSHTVVAITHRALWTDAADRVYHLDARGVELVSVE